MAWKTQVFIYYFMACALQGGSALRPEDQQSEALRMSLTPKNFQRTSPTSGSAADEALDKALAGATASQKQKLVDSHEAEAFLQTSAHSFSRMKEEIENDIKKASKLEHMSEDERFNVLDKHTAKMLNLWKELKSLKDAEERVSGQKREALQVLQDLGLATAPKPRLLCAGTDCAGDDAPRGYTSSDATGENGVAIMLKIHKDVASYYFYMLPTDTAFQMKKAARQVILNNPKVPPQKKRQRLGNLEKSIVNGEVEWDQLIDNKPLSFYARGTMMHGHIAIILDHYSG